jgi:L-lysine exporter family protein LysE/ArgO
MDHFIHGFLLSLSLCLDLGLVNVAIVRTGLQRGMQPAFMIGLGSCVGDMFYAVLSLVALSLVLDQPIVRWALWVFGSAYLAYLTVKMFRESFGKTVDYSEGVAATTGATRHIAQGVGLALSSPTAILWFATVGGSVIAASAGHRDTLLPFFSGFFTCGVLWAGVMALVAGKGRQVMGNQFVRALSFASALLFLYFAVKVFADGYTTLVR